MPEDIKKWLDELGLSQYVDAFDENDIGWSVLPKLDHDLLKEMGIKSIGHRVQLLEAPSKLDDQKASAETESEKGDTPGDAERRQLTVMFCDLVGSTELSRRLDPEEMREVNRAFEACCEAAIKRYDGFLARYMGDGVLAYFGYPQAHEDDAERAIRGGLEIVASVRRIRTAALDSLGVTQRTRVGIATGPVVVEVIGEGAAQESAISGDAPNLANRLQSKADDNTVVIGPGTYQLAGVRFECDNLGEHSFKGFDQPIHAWRVAAPIRSESRFEARQRAGLTPLVGREHEIGLLRDRWAHAKESDGQVVLLSGEAGIGKSRITEALRERTAEENSTTLRYQCSPFYTNTALHPIIDQLERASKISDEDPSTVKLNKLESLIKQQTVDVSAVVPIFAALLSIPLEERYPPLELTPEQLKEQTLETLFTQMEGLSQHSPVLVIFEDLHWADPTSLELLGLVIERVQTIPVLVVLTHRPEFAAPWVDHTHVTSLKLNRFTRGLSSDMVDGITAWKPLPGEVLEQIIEKTDGVPLFVEELTKTILESGQLKEERNRYVATGTLQDVTIPATLHDSLMARLDRLGVVKEVAQTAAAIGREFDFDLLGVVSPLNFEELRDALSQLIDVGLIFRRGRTEDGAYIFKHALVQGAAYGSLLKGKRQGIHCRIAERLQEKFPERVESEPELAAYHFDAAVMPETAVDYWVRAGRRAIERSANLEAVAHFRAGLNSLLTLPESEERDRKELDVQLAMINPLMSTTTKGFASDEANLSSSRARELCEKLGETQRLGGVLFTDAVNHLAAGEYQSMKDIGTELVRLGDHYNDRLMMICGLEAEGWGALGLAQFSFVLSNTARRLKLHDPDAHNVHHAYGPIDERVTALVARSLGTWISGFPDQSRACSEEAISYGRKLNHDSTIAWALSVGGTWPAAMRRDRVTAERLANEVISLSDDQRSPLDLAWAQVFVGWAIGKQGDLDSGISLLTEGL